MEDIIFSTNHTSEPLYSSDDEESSWNFYLDNFVASPFGGDDHSFSSGYVSNAASSAMNKVAHPYDVIDEDDDDDDHCRAFGARRIPFKKSSLKRRRTRADFVDHDLEDTATSPDHTPKLNINNFNHFYLNSKEDFSDTTHLSQEQIMLQKKMHKQQEDSVCVRVSDQGEGECSYTELRRKGLCLVPISMLFNPSLAAS